MVAILVVLMFLVFIIISTFLQKKPAVSVEESHEARSPHALRPIPMGRFFTPNHLWVELNPAGVVRLGSDELVQLFLGTVDGVELKKPGEFVSRGEPLFTLAHGDIAVTVLSPISGAIETTNHELLANHEKLSADPYESGWLYQIKPTSLSADLKSFTIAEQAMNWMKNEFTRLKDFVQSHLPRPELALVTLNDGGILIDGIIDHLDRHSIKAFEKEFLTNFEEVK